MKILMITPEFPPNSLGGGGQVVRTLTQGLVRKSCQVIVLSGLYKVRGFVDRPYSTRFGETMVAWLPLIPTVNVKFQLKTILPPNLFSIAVLLKVFLKGDFDVVHIHGFGHLLCDFAAALSKLVGKPYVYTIHGFPKEPQRQGGLLKIVYGVYSRFIGGPLIHSTTKAVTVSESVARECAKYVKHEKIDVIPNGIDSSLYLEPPVLGKMQEVEERYRLKGNVTILGIGRLSKVKGFQYAINALPLLLRKVPKAHLVIVGEDDGCGYSRELKRLAEENGVKSHVSFVGRIDDVEEKNALLWQASVVVIPSVEETFGLVAVEAIASGRPIVASRVGGLPEILERNEESVLVEKGNVKQLADALITVALNRQFLSKAKANRVTKSGEFDVNRMVEAYSKLYDTICGTHIGGMSNQRADLD